MNFRKGIAVAVLHILIVCSLGAKLVYDRYHRPLVWVQVANYDPDLPIRGRYLSLNLEVPTEGISIEKSSQPFGNDKDGRPLYWEHPKPARCNLALRNDVLTAVGNEQGDFQLFTRQRSGQSSVVVVNTQTPFFIPEHFDNSGIRTADQLWMQATIPRKGPPRPVRLATKKNGVIVPFNIN